MTTNSEIKVVIEDAFEDDLEIGEIKSKETQNNSGTEESGEVISKEFSSVGPLPSEIIAGSSDKSSDYSSNAGIRGTSIVKQRHPFERRKSSGAVSMTSKSGRTRSTQSTGGSSGGSGLYSPTAKATPRQVWYGRWLFFSLLCVIASLLGYMTYTQLSGNETYLA